MADRPTFAHWLKILLIASLLGLNAVAAGAVEPTEVLADPVLEARARTISKELRCLVCQNQSIDDSDAELARDLRILVRERLVTGDTDSQVVDYVVSRYGDFVLLKPPLKSETYVLWFGPTILAGIALLAVAIYYRRARTPVEPEPLSAAEEDRLNRIMGDHT